MEQQNEEQNQMKGKHEEDSSHSIAEKMALVELEEKHCHQHLSLESRQFAPFAGVLNVGNSKPNETNMSAETAANKG
jgi:hypothetical protein